MKLVSLVVVSALLYGCKPKVQIDLSPYQNDLRDGWPDIIIPENNPLTYASINLGKQLFFDSRLSVDNSISCASCHKPENGFADGVTKSLGVDGARGFRNSGSLTNVAFLPYFNRDGGVKSLDVFSAVPIEDHAEMGFNLLLMAEQLKKDKNYVHQAKEIYDRPIDGFVVTRALASYLRTFISDNSDYDRYFYDGDSLAMTASQQRGYQLFKGKGQCINCHSGVNFSNYEFENNGLYNSYKNIDRGRERITLDHEDEGKFRVASLRNIALTAPYMHDGSLSDLQSVLAHYSSNGKNHDNENPLIDNIDLSEEESNDIIRFLQSLTDSEYIANDNFRRGYPVFKSK